MSGSKTSTTNSSTTPTFGAQGQSLINSLVNGFQGDNVGDSEAGKFLTGMLTSKNPYLEDQVAGIRQASATELPKALASARSMTRGRPDTFGSQVASNVVADNLIGRDNNILQLLANQHNQDKTIGGQAASTLLSAQNADTGNQMSLLSLLRGEDTTSKTKTKSSNPLKTLASVAATVGGFMTMNPALIAGGMSGMAGD